MKILQISALFPPHVGGIETHVYALSNYLVKKGHDVTVFTSNVPKTVKHEITEGIKVNRFTSICSPLNNQFTPGLFLKLITNRDFDLIHAHSHLHLTSNITVLSKIFTKLPLVITSHGTVEYYDWRDVVNRIYNPIGGRLTVKSADRIIALTAEQASILEGLGAKRRDITIIPNGIDMEKINLSADGNSFRDRYGLTGKKVILYVGGLIPRKGINYLIESIKAVEGDVVLVIVGGELSSHKGVKSKLEKIVRNEKLKNVVFTGNLTGQSLEDAYAAADVFVLPSLAEGLPLVLLEAMAYGRAVIATDVPGNSDVVQDNENGILVESKNPSQIAEKINYVLKNSSEQERLGKNARIVIEKEYSWDTIIDKTIDVYEDLEMTN